MSMDGFTENVPSTLSIVIHNLKKEEIKDKRDTSFIPEPFPGVQRQTTERSRTGRVCVTKRGLSISYVEILYLFTQNS